jgi:hypothetical protein
MDSLVEMDGLFLVGLTKSYFSGFLSNFARTLFRPDRVSLWLETPFVWISVAIRMVIHGLNVIVLKRTRTTLLGISVFPKVSYFFLNHVFF